MICRGCEEELPSDQFPVRNDRSGRHRPYCYSCNNSISRKRYEVHRREQPFKLRLTRAKARASGIGVPFDLDQEYLEQIWTGICPVLNAPITLFENERESEFTAELDRFIPNKGYTKGNVHFLSRRANRLKNNVTTSELKQLIVWMELHENK